MICGGGTSDYTGVGARFNRFKAKLEMHRIAQIIANDKAMGFFALGFTAIIVGIYLVIICINAPEWNAAKDRELAERIREKRRKETAALNEVRRQRMQKYAAFADDEYLFGLTKDLDITFMDLCESLKYRDKYPTKFDAPKITEWEFHGIRSNELIEYRLRMERPALKYIDSFYGRPPGHPEWQHWVQMRQA